MPVAAVEEIGKTIGCGAVRCIEIGIGRSIFPPRIAFRGFRFSDASGEALTMTLQELQAETLSAKNRRRGRPTIGGCR